MDTSAFDKSLSILESQISGVETYADGLEKWLWISSIAVIIGVAFELWFVVDAYIGEREERIAWLKGSTPPPARPKIEILALEIASIALVVLGISGEFGVGILASNANARLRSLNSSRVQLVRQRASEADAAAASARKDAGVAIERALATEKEASALRKEAEDERLARVNLEAGVAWRRMGPEQRSALVSLLSLYSGESIGFAYNASDIESANFASDIALALDKKWRVLAEPLGVFSSRQGPAPRGTTPPLDRGVLVMSTADQKSRDAARDLVSALLSLGFDSRVGSGLENVFPTMMHHGGAAVWVMVEPRPDGPQGQAKLRAQQTARIRK